MWLKFTHRGLLHILIRDPDSIVCLPTTDEISFNQEAITDKYPHVPDMWAAVYSLKLLVQEPGGDRKQNEFFNECTHGRYINSVFVFSPDGKYARHC